MNAPLPLPVLSTGFAPIRLTTKIRMISQIQNRDLTAWEDFETIWEFNSIPNGGHLPKTAPAEVFVAVILSHVKMKATEYFIDKLRTDHAFKLLVGGTRWSVEIKDLASESVPVPHPLA